MYKLTIIRGPDVGRDTTLGESGIVVGREPGKGGLQLADGSVSRRHFRIRLSPSGVVLEDMGSRNGTLVNGRSVKRVELSDGDIISAGASEMRFASGRSGNAAGTGHGDYQSTATVSVYNLTRDLLEFPDERLDDKACRRTRDILAAAHRAGQAIGSLLEPQELYPRLTAILLEEFPKAACCAALLQEETGVPLSWRAASCREGGPLDEEKSRGLELAETALKQERAALFPAVREDEDLQTSAAGWASQGYSAMAAPFATRSGLRGVLYLDSRSRQRVFNEEDVRLLAMLAMQAGAAVENAELYRRLLEEKRSLQDSHERLQMAQEHLIRSEKLAAVGQLASGVVHDIRNPLTVILGHAQIMRMHARSRNIADEFSSTLGPSLDEIEKGVAHANEIVDQLLQFTRQNKPRRKALQLNKLLLEVLRFIKPELVGAKIECEQELADGLPAVRADRNQLKQVFINIFMNAIQAMEPGGVLSITSARGRRGDGQGIVITISDTGSGMDEETRRRLFDPFFTTKDNSSSSGGGTGLGLAVSYGIIQNHDGDIEVQSAPGAGTRFTLWLPEADVCES